MPTYPFRCERGHYFEVTQKIEDERPTHCPCQKTDDTICNALVDWVPMPISFNALELEMNREGHGYNDKSVTVRDKK